jgi:hypothetical protein
VRWRRLAVVAAIALLLALPASAIASYAWLDHYRPLSYDGGGWAASGTQLKGIAATVEPAAGSGGKTVYFPRFRRGRDFFVGITIWDRGRLDVTLLGVDDSMVVPGWIGMYPRDLRVAPPSRHRVTSSLQETKPSNRIVIRAHDQRFVWIGFRMKSCPGTQFQQSFDRAPVHFRYFGGHFTHTQVVVLPFAVTMLCNIPFPPSNSPILDRDGHPSRSRAARAAAERADARPARPHSRLRRSRLSL